MKKITIVIFLVVTSMLFSCTSERDKLVGVWKVTNVSISADSGSAPGSEISKAEKMQKSISFELFKDSTMSLMAGSSGMSGRWYFDKETGEVRINLDGSGPGDYIVMGKYDHGVIIKKEKHSFGDMTSVFEKR